MNYALILVVVLITKQDGIMMVVQMAAIHSLTQDVKEMLTTSLIDTNVRMHVIDVPSQELVGNFYIKVFIAVEI